MTVAQISQANPDEAPWSKVLRKLRTELGDDTFGNFLNSLDFETLEGNVLTLSVANNIARRQLAERYRDQVIAACEAVFGSMQEIYITERISTHKRQSKLALKTYTSPTMQIVPALLPKGTFPISGQPVRPAKPEDGRVTKIIELVREDFKITDELLRGHSNNRTANNARRIVIYLLRTLTDATADEIGTALGGRTVKSIQTQFFNAKKGFENDSTFRGHVERIRNRFTLQAT